jgi:hypothetical protein
MPSDSRPIQPLLTGASTCRLVQLKVDFAERYKGNPSRADFDAFLGQRGFACVLAYHFGTMGHLAYVSGDARARAPGSGIRGQENAAPGPGRHMR